MPGRNRYLMVLALLGLAGVGLALYRVNPAQLGALGLAITLSVAAAALLALAATAVTHLRAKRTLLSTPAIGALVLSGVCLAFASRGGPVLVALAAANLGLAIFLLFLAIRADRVRTSPPADDGRRTDAPHDEAG